MSARQRRKRDTRRKQSAKRMSARRRMIAGAGLTVGATLGIGSSAQAAVDTITVNSLNDPGTGTCDVTECTLREAINLANADNDTTDQDRIVFQAGLSGTITLNGPLPFLDEPLYIDGPGFFGPGPVTVSGGGTTNIFSINTATGADVTIDGLTLRDGSTSNSPGSAITSFNADLTVKGSTITANSSSSNFGGSAVASQTGGTTTIQNSTISNNTSSTANGRGGGLSVNSAVPQGGAGPTTITNSTISGNTMTGLNGQGAGVNLQDTTATIENSTISNNSTTNGPYAFGGGVVSSHTFVDGSTTITGSTISGNSSNGAGGLALNFGTNTIQNSYITGNDTTGGGGAGLSTYYGTNTIQGSTISGNEATGVGTYGPASGGGLASEYGTLTVQTSTISGNSSDGPGGGFNAHRVTTATIERSTISGNHTHNGGDGPGVAAYDSTMTIESSTISGNNHLAGGDPEAGGGLYSTQYGATTIRNSTIAGNSADSGGGVYVKSNDVQPEITNSIVANNTAGTGPELESPDRTFRLAFTLVENTSSAPIANAVPFSNITGVDPQLGPLGFNGGPTQTQALAATSPAVDCGMSEGVTTDQRGEVRPFDHPGRTNSNVSGANGADMGAFELIAGAIGGACTNLTPAISINDVSVNEAAGNAVFTVSRSSGGGPSSVDYGDADGTASLASGDFGQPFDNDASPNDGTLDFANGETAKTISVPIGNDATDEPDETFFVNLTNPSGGTIADNQGIGTIIDDDSTPSLSIDDQTTTEGDSGTTNAVFTVTLSAASGQQVQVDAKTTDASAGSPADFSAVALHTLTFAPGQTSKTVTVPIQGDTLDESNETYTVDLSSPVNAPIADNQGIGTIIDDDVPVTPVTQVTPTTPSTPAPAASCNGRAASIVGTNGSDQLSGTPAADVIAALGGNDKVSGLAGNDTICGGSGKDTLSGGKGNDKLYGEAGKDTLKGGPGKDKLKGGAGKDKQVQ